jgi:hypothetical protein
MNTHTIINTIVEHSRPKIMYMLFKIATYDTMYFLSTHLTLQSAIDAYSNHIMIQNVAIFEVDIDKPFQPQECYRYSFTIDKPKILIRYKNNTLINGKCEYEKLDEEKHIEVDKTFKWVMDKKFKETRANMKYKQKLIDCEDDMKNLCIRLSHKKVSSAYIIDKLADCTMLYGLNEGDRNKLIDKIKRENEHVIPDSDELSDSENE